MVFGSYNGERKNLNAKIFVGKTLDEILSRNFPVILRIRKIQFPPVNSPKFYRRLYFWFYFNVFLFKTTFWQSAFVIQNAGMCFCVLFCNLDSRTHSWVSGFGSGKTQYLLWILLYFLKWVSQDFLHPIIYRLFSAGVRFFSRHLKSNVSLSPIFHPSGSGKQQILCNTHGNNMVQHMVIKHSVTCSPKYFLCIMCSQRKNFAHLFTKRTKPVFICGCKKKCVCLHLPKKKKRFEWKSQQMNKFSSPHQFFLPLLGHSSFSPLHGVIQGFV